VVGCGRGLWKGHSFYSRPLNGSRQIKREECGANVIWLHV
jgi:hypothetical protein